MSQKKKLRDEQLLIKRVSTSIKHGICLALSSHLALPWVIELILQSAFKSTQSNGITNLRSKETFLTPRWHNFRTDQDTNELHALQRQEQLTNNRFVNVSKCYKTGFRHSFWRDNIKNDIKHKCTLSSQKEHLFKHVFKRNWNISWVASLLRITFKIELLFQSICFVPPPFFSWIFL